MHNIIETHFGEAHPFTHLHIRPDGPHDSALIQFGSMSDPNHLSVSVKNSYTPILGEDLYALRALLNELPESAFVEPAPPLARWTKGDIVVVEEGVNGRVLAYYRHDDGFWRAAGTAMAWVDEEVSAWVDNEGATNTHVVRQASA
jgi:hypothetical protein